MKKLFLALLLVAGMTFGAQARDSYSRDVKTLPTPALNTIGKNFKAKVSLIKIDKTLGHVNDYEVILTDGTEVEFDAKGNLKSVDTPNNKSVPESLIPKAITAFVQKAHKGQKIVGIDIDSKGYDVELSNGIEIEFDHNGVFKKYD